MSRFGKVAVLLGGSSGERSVSLKSGEEIYQAMLRSGIDAVKIDPIENVAKQLQEHNIERAFIALHGPGGEDGTIQGMLEFLNIPYTGSGVKASALCMDKWRTKLIWSALTLPTPSYKQVSSVGELNEFAEKHGLPMMVKPALEGSSLGISKVSNLHDVEKAFEFAANTKSPVMVEQFIQGKEFTVAILNDTALPVIQLKTDNEFYDFNAKYVSNDTQYLVPCGLSQEKESELQALALQAYQSLDCRGWGRVDAMQDENGKFWLIEVNTVPGMTDHSLVPMAAKAKNMTFDDLIIAILDQTLATRTVG